MTINGTEYVFLCLMAGAEHYCETVFRELADVKAHFALQPDALVSYTLVELQDRVPKKKALTQAPMPIGQMDVMAELEWIEAQLSPRKEPPQLTEFEQNCIKLAPETERTRLEEMLRETEDIPFPEEEQFCRAACKPDRSYRVQILGYIVRIEQGTPGARQNRDILAAANCAADHGDYITALYWHQKLDLHVTQIHEQFRRKLFSGIAEYQQRAMPERKPFASSAELLGTPTELSSRLRDPAYANVDAAYKKQRRELFTTYMTQTGTVTAVEKTNNRSVIGVMIRVPLALAALVVGLWKLMPIVWGWHKALQDYNLITKILSLLPILPILLVILLLYLAFQIAFAGSIKADKKTEQTYQNALKGFHQELRKLPAYSRRKEMDDGIGQGVEGYGNRLVLAAVSTMYGLEDLTRVKSLAKQGADALDWWKNRGPASNYLKRDSSERALFMGLFLLTRELCDPRRAPNEKDIPTCRSLCTNSKRYDESGALEQLFKKHFLPLVAALPVKPDAALRASRKSEVGQYCCDMWKHCKYLDRKTLGLTGLRYGSQEMYHEALIDSMEYQDRPSPLGFRRKDGTAFMAELEAKSDQTAEERALYKRLKNALNSAQVQDRLDREWESEQRYGEERRRQEAYERKRAQLESDYDDLERAFNYDLHGGYDSNEERYVKGDMSYLDYNYEQHRRKKIIDSKMDEGED